jgi:hypothetical protein
MYHRGAKKRNLGAPDRAAEELGAPEGRSAALALDGEGGAEGGAAAGAAAEHLAAALRTRAGHVRLELLEPPAGGTAADTDGGPVAEHVPALLPQPVGGFAHG